jgi:hypothetical protein
MRPSASWIAPAMPLINGWKSPIRELKSSVRFVIKPIQPEARSDRPAG